MLQQSRVEALTLNLAWPNPFYTLVERSLILSRIFEALGFIAQLPLLDKLDFNLWTWKAGFSDGIASTSFPMVLNMKIMTAPAELLFFIFSRPLTVPRLREIYLAFYISEEGMFDITTTATSIARLRDSVGPMVDILPAVFMDSVPPPMESLCDGIQPICPIWEQEFSKFTAVMLVGQITLLDSPNTFRIILGVLTLFSGISGLLIKLRPSPKVDPTPIHLEPWMVRAILNRSPNITSIVFNKVAQRIIS